MIALVQDIDACINGMDHYVTSRGVSVSQGAFIVKRWMEHIKCTT